MAIEHSAPADTGQPEGWVRLASRRFGPSTESVAVVRRTVASHLTEETDACRDTAVTIASELAANAVLHARTAYIVELLVGEVVRIDVTDLAPIAPFVWPVSDDALSGRGLLIVSALADRWGVEWRDTWKVVWAEIARDTAFAG
jgi:hypothetical protein